MFLGVNVGIYGIHGASGYFILKQPEVRANLWMNGRGHGKGGDLSLIPGTPVLANSFPIYRDRVTPNLRFGRTGADVLAPTCLSVEHITF